MSDDKKLPDNIIVLDFSNAEVPKAFEAMRRFFNDSIRSGEMRAACVITVDHNGKVVSEFVAGGHDGHYIIGGAEMVKRAILDAMSGRKK